MDAFVDLAERYLASIPAVAEPVPRNPATLTPLAFDFPRRPVIEHVKVDLVEPVAHVQLTFPVQARSHLSSLLASRPHAPHRCRTQLELATSAEDSMWLQLSCNLLEQRLLRRLRFDSGGIYSCSVSAFFGCEAPSRRGAARGDLAVSFSCDPSSSDRLSQMAVNEIELLQCEGPERDEAATVLTVEQRQHENELQENEYWLQVRSVHARRARRAAPHCLHSTQYVSVAPAQVMVRSYKSRRYQELQDLDAVHALREAARAAVFSLASPEHFRDALRRLLPLPCRARYTLITMLPKGGRSRAMQTIAATSALFAGVLCCGRAVLRWWRRSR